jgi:outer membrane protein OmpA-like peptidoglycan-associated protein
MGTKYAKFAMYTALFLLGFRLWCEDGHASLTTKERTTIGVVGKTYPTVSLEIPFGYRSIRIERDFMEQLDELGKALTDPIMKGVVVQISGHTATEGDDTYELKLSELRAKAIKRFLIENFDLDPDSLIAVGYGSRYLRDPGDPRSDENRRVEIINLTIGN